jgi:hypothetical protein
MSGPGPAAVIAEPNQLMQRTGFRDHGIGASRGLVPHA